MSINPIKFDNHRKSRGVTQKLYLVETIEKTKECEREYLVMGSTGNVYSVLITNKSTCTCPDFKKRESRCKHIFFVLMKIMQVEDPDQDVYSNDELIDMFKRIPKVTDILCVSKEVKKKYENLKNKNITEKDLDDMCPICLDELENGTDLCHCRFSCGRHVHVECFEMIMKNKKKYCIYCKQSWDEKPYINIAL